MDTQIESAQLLCIANILYFHSHVSTKISFSDFFSFSCSFLSPLVNVFPNKIIFLPKTTFISTRKTIFLNNFYCAPIYRRF